MKPLLLELWWSAHRDDTLLPQVIVMSTGKAVDATRPTSDYELWALLDATGFAISRLRELELGQFGLTIEQAAILKFLQTVGRPTTVKEIEDLTLRQQHSISILINRMDKMGLVTRERGPGEKSSRILITDLGRSLLRNVTTASLKRAFSVLTSRERPLFACSLRSLHEQARRLLIPGGVPFMRYITPEVAPETIRSERGGGARLSDYRLWSSLDGARFAISRLRELELATFGLSIEQASVLRLLRDGAGSTTAKDLEDITLRQHHSVSTLINRMIRMGVVRRAKKPAQKSQVILITEAGKQLFEGITAVAPQMAFAPLKRRQKRQLAVTLYSLLARARGLLGASQAPVATWSETRPVTAE
jgi:DNA-binding MarR family transcriptional regulator